MIHLVEINGDNYRRACGLQVTEAQKHYVCDALGILARAYAYREEGGHAQIICDDDRMVGLVLTRCIKEWDSYDLDQFFIDQRFQRRGFGRAAVELVLDQLKEEGLHPTITLCYCEGDEAARRLYEKCGFTHTGEVDEDEIIMSRTL